MTSQQDNPGSVTVAAVERAWGIVRSRVPDLPHVVVVLSAGLERHAVTWGHFVPEQWDTTGGTRHELMVSGECLSRGAPRVLQTVLHEATHALCYARGIKDTSRGGKYHNRRFVAVAETLGLEWPAGQSPDTTRGFSAMRLTEQARAEYAEALEVLERGRQAWRELVAGFEVAEQPAEPGDAAAEPTAAPRRPRSRNTRPKAVCACADAPVWASRRVLARATLLCRECGEVYRMAEPDGEDH